MADIYLNGAFLPLDQARVAVLDRGFLFGEGVCEVVPGYGGYFLRLDDHLDRLEDGLSLIRLDNPLTRDEWLGVLARLVGPLPADDLYAYIQVTRGAVSDPDPLAAPPPGPFGAGSVAPTVFAATWPLAPRPQAWGLSGVAAITRPDIRWQRCEIKSTSRLATAMLRREAEDEGALEAVLLRDGMLTQGAASNVFIALGDELITPPRGHFVFPGITREIVIELARCDGIRLLERRIPLEELTSADEIWLTSSSREILPVTRLDAAPIGGGVPGPLWRRMDALWQGYKARVRQGHGH